MIPTITENRSAPLKVERLSDAISCEVTKSNSGEFSLVLQYPADGVWAERLTLLNQINAITSRADRKAQPFFISKIDQNISGLITVTAYHKTYSLANYPVKAFDAEMRTPQEAIDAMIQNSPIPLDGLYVSAENWAERKMFGLKYATNWRDTLFGYDGLLDVYGGVLVVDGGHVAWHNDGGIGFERGTVKYGLNLSNFNRTYDISDTYSHAYVYWSKDETMVECPDLVCLGQSEEFLAATILDLSDYFETAPSVAQMEEKAKEVARLSGLTDIETSMDIAFVPLRLTEEYKEMSWLEEVDLFDFVNVDVPMFGKTTQARITKTEFDVLNENYKSIIVGTQRYTIDTTLARLIQGGKK